MKKFIVLFFAVTFAFCIGGAIANTVQGNHEVAIQFELAAGLSFAVPMVFSLRHVTGSAMGLLSKHYATDSPMDRPLSMADKRLWDYLTDVKQSGESKARVQTRELLLKGDLKIETYNDSLMFTQPVSQGGRRPLLDASISYAEGRIPQEFDRASLPEGFIIAVSHVGIGWATDAAITVPEGDVDYVTQPNSWPAALRNARFLISQNGALVQQFRAKFTGTQAASTNNAVEGDGLEFQKPFILEDVKSITIDIWSPANITFPATPAYQFIELKMFGSCVRPKQ